MQPNLASWQKRVVILITAVDAQADELYKICSIMGSPTAATWPEGVGLAASMGFRFPQCQPVPLATMVRAP